MAASAPVGTIQSREFGQTHESTSKKMNTPGAVLEKYAHDKPFSLLKFFYVLFLDVPRELGNGFANSEGGLALRKNMNIAKLLDAPGKFLHNANEWRKRTVEVMEKGPFSKAGYEWLKAANQMVNPTFDGIDFLTKTNIAPLPKETFAIVKGVNGGSMVAGFGAAIVEDCIDIKANRVNETKGELQEHYRQVGIQTLLKTAYDISLFAIGLMTVLATFFAVVVPGVLFVGFSAASVVVHIAKYFYENIGEGMDPAKNGVKNHEESLKPKVKV